MKRRYWFPKHYADEVQRLRVACGFALVAAFVIFSAPTRGSIIFGMGVALFGILLRAWAAGHLAKNEALATGGPYAFVRNPLYLGTLIAATGLVIASRQLWLGILFGLVFLLVYLPAIELEEQYLRVLFPEYETYAASVPLMFPVRRPISSQGRFRFSLYARNQEYQAMGGILLGAALLAWKAGLLGFAI